MDPMEEEKADDSSSDLESDDSDSDEEIQHQTMDDGTIDRLEAKLMANPYQYEDHVHYVESLRKMGDLERLRKAREAMNAIFPLPEEQWLRWLEDEERLVSSEEEKTHIKSLFDRSTKEYLSVPIWLKYTSFAERQATDPNGDPIIKNVALLKSVRDAFELALSQAGIHISQGDALWKAYRAFEQKILRATMEKKAASTEVTKQVDLIRNLFRRQLTQPLKGLEETFVEYKKWEEQRSGSVAAEVESGYQQAVKLKEERAQFEQHVEADEQSGALDFANLKLWKPYLDLEEQKSDPRRAVCLYERALKKYYLSGELWQRFLSFLDHKLGSTAITTYQRAVRNVPWSGQIWGSYIRALERLGRTDEEIQSIFNKALAAGMQQESDYLEVFTAHADYELRRARKGGAEGQGQFRAVMNQSLEYLSTYFPEGYGQSQLQLFLAGIESRVFANFEKAREIYEALVKSHSKEAEYWLIYTDLERFRNEQANCRTLFKRACHSVKDSPERIWSAWLSFERETGTLEQYDLAVQRTTKAAKDVEAARAAQQAEEIARQQAYESKRNAKNPKRKRENAEEEERPRKRSEKPDRSDRPDRSEKAEVTDLPAKNERTAKTEKPEKPERPEVDASGKQPRTIFLVNLPYTMSEAAIKEMCSKFGNVVAVRMAGGKRGLAYVDFETEEEAQKALVMDQTEVGGRKLKVSISTPPTKKSFNDTLTVYISNLATGVTENDLRPILGSGVKEIRIPLGRSGAIKGFAYVDFEDEASLLAALKSDKTELKGKAIEIARSKPRKTQGEGDKQNSEKGPTEAPIFKTPKPRAMLVPRTVRKPAGDVTPKTDNSANSGPKTPMSNEEFRKKFLNK